MDFLHAFFVEPWPWWGAALAIAGVSTALVLIEGRFLGVSTGYSVILGNVRDGACGDSAPPQWRGWFLIGLPLGGLAGVIAGGWAPTLSMGSLGSYVGSGFGELGLLAVGGLLIGWGTRQGAGCTSGHGIVGCALFRPVSLVSTGVFFAFGALAANLVRLWGAA